MMWYDPDKSKHCIVTTYKITRSITQMPWNNGKWENAHSLSVMLFKAYRVTFTVPTHKDDKHSLLQLNDPLQIMVKYHKHNLNFSFHDPKTASLHSSLCSYIPWECCTLLIIQNLFIQTKTKIRQKQRDQVPVRSFWTSKKQFQAVRN